jgi:hypothetical protein
LSMVANKRHPTLRRGATAASCSIKTAESLSDASG